MFRLSATLIDNFAKLPIPIDYIVSGRRSDPLYFTPKDLPEALEIAATHGGRIIAGGTDVYPSLAQGATPGVFLDVSQIGGLRGLNRTDTGLQIGAATTWTDIATANLPPAYNALQQAARVVGSIQIQNTATIAGNICNASPAADGVPPLLALDAQVNLASKARGPRTIQLSEFLLGVRKTAMEPDEIVLSISVPHPPRHAGSQFEKLGSRKYLVISIAMVAAVVAVDPAGVIEDARIAVGAASAVAQRLPALERACIGRAPSDIQIDPRTLSTLSPIDDSRGTADYRMVAVAELCQRAIRKASIRE